MDHSRPNPRMCVNGVRIGNHKPRLEFGEEPSGESMDWPHLPHGPPEIMGTHPPFLGTPAQTLIEGKDGPDLTILGPARRWRVNGVGKRVSLAAIRVWKESVLETRRMGGIYLRISPGNHGPAACYYYCPKSYHNGGKWREFGHSRANEEAACKWL